MAKSLLITRIGELVTNAPDADAGGAVGGPGGFASLDDAALVIEGDRIAWTGPSSRAPAADALVDAADRAVLPGFVDSHSHLVFAGERSAEFAARMAGRPYAAGATCWWTTCPGSSPPRSAPCSAERRRRPWLNRC